MLILSSGSAGSKRLAPVQTPTSSIPAKARETIDSISDTVEKSTILSTSLTAAASVARSFKAFPNFVYPSVYDTQGWERDVIFDHLDKLPLHQVNDVKAIRMVDLIPNHNPGYVTNGQAWGFAASNEIQLSRTELTTPDKLRGTLTHEIGHTVDFESRWFKLFGERSSKQPFGEGPHITEYAKTNHFEDFAESYEEYHLRPEKLKEVSPEKFAEVEKLSKPSFLEALVDRHEFRETGKFVAEAIGPNRVARHAVQSAYYASSALQLGHGISQWARSAETGDPLSHANGILNSAAGLAFFTGMSPLVGMGIQGAAQALGGAVRRGTLKAEEVESTVALPVRPIEAVFGRKATPIAENHRPGKVAAVAVGGALGGTAGALAGPYLGVMAGYHIAGGVGGAIGMVAGGLGGFLAGSEIGGRLGGAIAGAF